MTLFQRLALMWRILIAPGSELLAHADRELGIPRDDFDRAFYADVKAMLLVFSTQGHSGTTAAMLTSMLGKLLRFQPLGPLTGEDSEWVQVSEDPQHLLWQNRRCAHVFKTEEYAYDLDAVIFEEPDGVRYTSNESRERITFPYTPKTRVVKVAASAAPEQAVAVPG